MKKYRHPVSGEVPKTSVVSNAQAGKAFVTTYDHKRGAHGRLKIMAFGLTKALRECPHGDILTAPMVTLVHYTCRVRRLSTHCVRFNSLLFGTVETNHWQEQASYDACHAGYYRACHLEMRRQPPGLHLQNWSR